MTRTSFVRSADVQGDEAVCVSGPDELDLMACRDGTADNRLGDVAGPDRAYGEVVVQGHGSTFLARDRLRAATPRDI